MAKKLGGISADLDEAMRLASTMKALNGELNTDRHLNIVTRSAYEMMASEFNLATNLHAQANVMGFHHIYEWDHVGVPGFQLYKMRMNGQGGHRRISWDWRASKTTVPTTTTVTGEDKFREHEKFDPEKLRRIHVFVWKAPMMEYGVSVRINPKLSKHKYLVFPDAELRGKRTNRPSPAVFTKAPVEVTPGAGVQGNFTAWFVAWWGPGGAAQNVIDRAFSDERDEAFAQSFKARVGSASPGRRGTKRVTFTPNGAIAAQGERAAKAIARDMEVKYIEGARRRARWYGTGEEEDE